MYLILLLLHCSILTGVMIGWVCISIHGENDKLENRLSAKVKDNHQCYMFTIRDMASVMP